MGSSTTPPPGNPGQFPEPKAAGQLVEDLKQVLLRFYPGRDWGQLRGEERAQRRRTVRLVSGAAALLLLLASVATYQWRSAVEQRNTALARQLAAQAQMLMSGEPYLMARAAALGASR